MSHRFVLLTWIGALLLGLGCTQTSVELVPGEWALDEDDDATLFSVDLRPGGARVS